MGTLTNRFHFAVVCSVIDAQMTSQRGMVRTNDPQIGFEMFSNFFSKQSQGVITEIYWFSNI